MHGGEREADALAAGIWLLVLLSQMTSSSQLPAPNRRISSHQASPPKPARSIIIITKGYRGCVLTTGSKDDIVCPGSESNLNEEAREKEYTAP